MDGNNLSHIAFHKARTILVGEKSEATGKHAKEITLELEDHPKVLGMMILLFFRKLHKYLKKYEGANFIMAWDNFGSREWRRNLYPEYKADRDYATDPIWKVLFEGIRQLQSIIDCYGIVQISQDKLEADDILYKLGGILSADNDVIIVSGDSDLVQIAQKFKLKIFHPVKDKYVEIPKDHDICVFKAIKGEKSDHIDGIRGYGNVKSLKLAQEYFTNSNAIKETLSPDQVKIFERNMKLIDISNNPNLKDLNITEERIKNKPTIDLTKIKKFYFDNKVRSLLEDFESVVSVLS